MRIVSVLLTMALLAMLPLPVAINPLRPACMLLLLLYMQTYAPAYFHILLVLVIGLSMDALFMTPMGEHAFALVITTWLMAGWRRRFVCYALLQQSVMIAVLGGCYQLILWIAETSFGYWSSWLQIFGTMLSSMVCWPLVVQMMLWRGRPGPHAGTLMERF